MNSLHNKTIPAARFSNLLFLFVFLLFLPAAGSGETEKSGVAPQVLSLPSGPGSIEGLGESFEPDLNTGTSTYGVKIAVSPGVAGFEPQIRLVYNSGYGNSPVGLGWDLNLEYIQRQTDKGLPAYADSDTFIHSAGGELVPLPDGVFRQKIEGSFTKFKRTDEGWEAWRRNGTRLFFGTAVESRQTHAGLGIFAWYLEKEIDPNGNEIRYQYATDQGKVYLQEIRYSIMADTVCKSVRFLYEDRPDIATSYVSRAKVVTARRLKTIEVRSEDNLVRSYQLTYAADSGFSLLAAVTQYGSDNITALPPLHFSYSSYRPDNHQTVIMTNTPPAGVSLTNANVDLVDINGDALPDLIHTDSTLGRHDFYINEGNGSWNPTPTTPDNSPPSLLMQDGVMMADMNGDGNSDLFVKNSSQFGYFKNTRTLKWEEADWSDCTPNPGFSFESQTVKLLDVNNDKLIDVLIDSGSSYRVWLNRTNNQWSEQFDFETFLPDGHLSLTSPFVKMGDMNGDRIQDLVYVLDGYIAYFPGMGNGQFDSEVEMVAPPANLGSNAAKLATADIDSNGLDDLVLVGNENVMVWFNGGNGGFLAPVTFTGTPPFQEPATYRFADMNGDGLVDLLLTNENSVERFVYVDFTRGTHPNLLTGIDNGLGMRTTIAYKASTVDYLNDRAAGSPWTETLPFPVQVVASVAIEDGNSGQQYRSEYRYRDGYYDGVEKEFRGFGSVRKLEMGEATAPSLLSLFQFDTGKTEESRKGLVTLAATLTGNGSLEETASLFDRQDNTVHTTHLVTGLNGENVRFSYLDSTTTRIFEQSGQPLTLYHVFEQDEYGNTVKDFNYGRVNGSDYGVGDDEVLTTTSYAIDEEAWMVDRPATINITDLQGRFAALQQNTYDARGNLVREDHSPDGSAFIPLVRREYDSHGNVITTTDANDHCRQVTYDSRFHTLPVTESICGLGLEMTADYDHGLGVLTDYTDFNHQVTNFAYDPLGRLTAIVKPGDSALYPTQVFAYSLANPVSSILTRTREQSGAPGTYDTVAYFDGLGRKLQTRSEGEGGDWVVTEAVAFNQRREVAARWLPYSDGTADFASPAVDLPKESLAYDAKKRVTRRTNADATYQTTAHTPLARIEQDEEDNTVGGVHAGTPHTFYSDGLERLVRVEERNGATVFTTRYGYDARGNLVRVEDNEGNVKTMTYDGLGRKIAMDDPDKHQMHYVYDPAGNLTATTDAKGQTVAYTYDAANRMLTETFGAVRVRYHYDNDLAADHPAMANTRGRLAWVEDEAGREFFSYDPRGNVTTKVREAGGSTFTSVMAWDAMNRLTSLTYPDGTVVTYRYNDRNLLEQIPGYVDTIEYNPAGRKTRLLYANGLESTYHYDQRQRLTDLQSTRQTSVLQKLAYQYDGASNILAITDGRTTPTPESLSRTFRYDDLYRLTEASAPDWMESYQYSSIGNMTFKSDVGVMTYGAGTAGPHAVTGAAGAGLTYTYDLNGNLATKRPGFSYQFDHRDRLARVEREADQAAVTFAYDYQGNRKTKMVTRGAETATTIYVDQHNEVRGSELVKQVFADDRLVARMVTPLAPGTVALRTNPLSAADFDTHPADGVISLEEIRRQGENDSAMEPEEAADALRLYYAHLGDTPTMLPFATMAVAMRELGTPAAVNTGTVFFYLPDHLGSPAVVTDRNGDIVEESAWYPYGTERKRTGTVASSYRFTGKELDDETGLYYFGARYYDAQVGRFMSLDPLYLENPIESLKNSQSQNIYSYAHNPIAFVDPQGFDFFKINVAETVAKNIIKTMIKAPNLKIIPVSPKGMGGGSYFDRAVKATFKGGYWRRVPNGAKIGPIFEKISKSAGKFMDNDFIGGTEKLVNNGFALTGVLTDFNSEMNSRGYSWENLGDSIINIKENVQFARENPDALLNSLEEGVTSMTAVTINSIVNISTKGKIETNIRGKDIQNTLHKPIDKLVDFYYK